MATSLESRAVFVIDGTGNKSPQGIFPGQEFDHLVGKTIELEHRKTLRELVLWTIYNTLVEEMPNPQSKDMNHEELIHLMSMALAEARYARGKGKIKLAGKIEDPTTSPLDTVILAKIYSRPKIEGIRIELPGDELETLIFDLAENNIDIKVRKYPHRKLRKLALSEFLREHYDPEEASDKGFKEEHVIKGRSLHDEIFHPKRGLQ